MPHMCMRSDNCSKMSAYVLAKCTYSLRVLLFEYVPAMQLEGPVTLDVPFDVAYALTTDAPHPDVKWHWPRLPPAILSAQDLYDMSTACKTLAMCSKKMELDAGLTGNTAHKECMFIYSNNMHIIAHRVARASQRQPHAQLTEEEQQLVLDILKDMIDKLVHAFLA